MYDVDTGMYQIHVLGSGNVRGNFPVSGEWSP